MDISGIAKSISEIGFGAVAMGAVLFAAWKLLNWGKEIVDNAMVQLDRERQRSAEVYEKLSHAIEDHTTQAKEFHSEVRTAHGYQREEHNKLIDSMAIMCSEVKKHSENSQKEHERMICNLEEQGKTLLRINGYTHEGPKGECGERGERGERGES